jgi:hypothetical protein
MTQEVGDLGTHELLTGPPVMTPHPFMKLCRLWTRYATKCSGSDHHTHRLRLPAAHYSTAQALTMATLMPLVKWLAPPGTRPCKMASSLPLSVVGDDSILTLGGGGGGGVARTGAEFPQHPYEHMHARTRAEPLAKGGHA